MSGRSCYDALSSVYDVLNGDVDYDGIAGAVGSLLSRYGGEVRSVLDLGCGTGPLTERLAGRYSVTALDVSSDMLAAAAARSGCRNVFFIRGDMRRFRLIGAVDAAVSTQDSISHLTRREDLVRCFSSVAEALRPGGAFVFDVNTEYRMREIYGDNTFVLEEDGVVAVWRNEYDAKSKRVTFRVTVFKETPSGLWERDDGETRERGWSVRSIRSALAGAGFGTALVASAWDLGEPTETTERLVFVAVKGGKTDV